MKRIALLFCTASILLFACNSAGKKETTKDNADNSSAIKAPDKEWVPVDTALEMKAWKEYSTPGEPHKMLAKLNGTWDGATTMWMAIDAPGTQSKSTTVNEMIFDGRYQVSKHQGDFMGMPFMGLSTTAYDNYKKVFMSTWVDNMGTGIMTMQGTWDDATKTLTTTGKMTSPVDGRECEMKETLQIIDDNNHVMSMYGPDPKTGKQFKTMEIKYTKKK